MLIDTDVLIFNLRGNENAAAFLDAQDHITLSAVTWMELIQGVRNKQELRSLREALRYWGANIQPLNEEISARAQFWLETYALSHGMRTADALIAATAWYLACPLMTANERHYRFIDDFEVQVFRP